MKKTLDKIVLFISSIALFDMISFATAQKPKEIDELDMLIAKSKKSMSKAGSVVKAAAKAQEKAVSEVVSHIEEVEHEVEVAQQKVEIFSARMIESGVDTSMVEQEEEKVEYVVEIKEAYQKYVDQGGDYDIENFILYVYNKKIN
jgi:TolA-binding protein